jgi:hypothetical protein
MSKHGEYTPGQKSIGAYPSNKTTPYTNIKVATTITTTNNNDATL